MKTKPKWTLTEAVELCRSIWEGCASHGYYPSITGSVLYNNYSDNDLDIVLYPHGCLHSDYRPCIDFLKKQLSIYKIEAVDRNEESDYKLVLHCVTNDERVIQFFIPNFTFKGRLDSYPAYLKTETKSS